MINVRSITYSLPEIYSDKEFNIIKLTNRVWDNSKYFIRTKRVTLKEISNPISMNMMENLNKFCLNSGIRWFDITIDPYNTSNPSKIFNFAKTVLQNYSQSFINILCVKDKTINFSVLDESVKLIKKVAECSSNGKDNFRLGLSTNVNPDCPFFPFSFSSGNFSFSIALELTQEINEIIKQNSKLNLNELRDNIINTVKPQVDELLGIALDIEKLYNIKFNGFDFSLAPIIDKNGSIITILNYLGVNNFSNAGTMFATAYLTNILKYFASIYKSTGFSGVMYSLLEDLELCKLNNSVGVKVEDLIKLSTMCGCGLDMVPISIKTDNDQIKTLIIEVIGISCRLNKPLGIRILPIPNVDVDEEAYTNFNEDADFISNTKILKVGNNEIINKNIIDFSFIQL